MAVTPAAAATSPIFTLSNLGLDLPLRWKVHDAGMTVTVLYFDGCPSWELARDRSAEALRLIGASNDVELRRV